MHSGKVMKGLGVSPGICIGKVLALENVELNIPMAPAESPEKEMARLEMAIAETAADTQAFIDLSGDKGKDTSILETYLMLVEDDAVTNASRSLISNEQYNAVRAAYEGIGSVVEMFESMDDTYMKERAFDIRDIRRRITMKLLGIREKDLSDLGPDTVIVAEELTTSDTARLDFSRVVGIITCIGGENSHSSIIARSFEIPALAGVKNALEFVQNGDEIVLDAVSGTAYVDPDPEVLSQFQEKRKEYQAEKARLEQYRGLVSQTADNYHVEINCNIGDTVEIGRVLENTADGIGLFRSEFLYMNSRGLPDEETQYNAYKEAVMAMAPKPVIIRTMDIGGDKDLPALNLEKEENPFLGYRAIRICLDRPDFFSVQIRALLRASHFGNVKIMLPMISCPEELQAAKSIVENAKHELRGKGVPFNETVPLGIMIEVPSAAIMASELAQECDFFSIGTNDLIQYTVAADRGNEKVSNLYSQYHPAVLRLLAQTIKSAHDANIPCGMCGEAAGDPLLIPVLLGMGLDEFSVSAGMVLRVREIISKMTITKAREIAQQVLYLPSRSKIFSYLQELRL